MLHAVNQHPSTNHWTGCPRSMLMSSRGATPWPGVKSQTPRRPPLSFPKSLPIAEGEKCDRVHARMLADQCPGGCCVFLTESTQS